MASAEEPEPADDGRSAVRTMRSGGVLRTPTLAEVDLGRLLHNLQVFRSKGAEVMAVVKADAYGHGAERVASRLEAAGVSWFAVATVAEGIQLRRAGIEGRILVLTAPLPQYLGAYRKHELDVTVSSFAVAEAVAAMQDVDSRIRAHVKVDTGMGRIGIRPEEAEPVMAMLGGSRAVEIAGIWTHFATADEPELDFAYEQLDRFDRVLAKVGDAAERIHVANSAAALRIPESLAFERALARVGIGLYGYTDLEEATAQAGLLPVMRMISQVTHVKWVDAGDTVSYGRKWKARKKTRIATVGAGYADGFPRLATNRAEVGIGDERYPVVGTVCMDMFMVDVGSQAGIEPGDEVVLFGEDGPDAFELAKWTDTIAYEILTRVTARVPRVYVG